VICFLFRYGVFLLKCVGCVMCVWSMWTTSYNIFHSFGALARSWEGWLCQKSSRDANIALGECKIAPWGSKITPGGLPKSPVGVPCKGSENRSPNKRSRAGKCIANASKNKIPNRNVGGTICVILHFCSPHRFWDEFVMVFSKVVGSICA
jgi:hypothetical protein